MGNNLRLFKHPAGDCPPRRLQWLRTGVVSLVSLGTLTCWFHGVAAVEADPVVQADPAVKSDPAVASARVIPSDPAVPPFAITSRSMLPQGSAGQDYAFQFTSTAKKATLEWQLLSPIAGSWDWEGWELEAGGRLTGKLASTECEPAEGNCPEGWTCGSGKRCEGVLAFNVIALDKKGQFDQRLFNLVVTDPANPLEVGSFPSLTDAAVGQPYEQQLYARGGRAPFTWSKSEGALPPGLTLDFAGVLSGTPITSGFFTWTVEVTDSRSKKASNKLTLRVADLSKPIVFKPNPKVVVRSTIPRIGLNVVDETIYWNDQKLSNQYIENPGLEPGSTYRVMYWAWNGSANTLEEWDLAQYLEMQELNTGYWDGGRYWILSGPAKGRTGRIAKYQRVADKRIPGGYRAVWTLADSDPSRVVEKKTDPKDMDKNIFMVEAPGGNDSNPRGTVPPGWFPFGNDEQAKFSVDTVKRATGTQSAKVVSRNSDTTSGFEAMVIFGNPWRRLRKDTTYRFSADVRQSGVAGGKVTMQMATQFSTEPFIAESFDVPDDGKFHHIAGQFVGGDQSDANLRVVIEGKGTLWLDNALLYESESTKTPAHGARQKGVPAKVFEPLPFVLEDLRRAKPGCLRFWYHGTGVPLQTALTASTESAPGPVHNIFANLKLAEMVGSNAWIIAAKEWLPGEFADLAEYLSSADTAKGLGKLRAEQGHPKPWTETIRRIYIEYGNETWNWPSYAYPFDPWHPAKYASFAKERFNAFRASKYYSPKITLVLSGQTGNDFWINDPVDKLAYPSHDAMDAAPYIDNFVSTPLNELSATSLGHAFGHAQSMPGTMKMWAARGENTKMLVYEGGPNAAGHRPSAADEIRKNSMILASLTLDSIAELFAKGVGEYNVFTYQGISAWQVITGTSSRFRLPIWYAISMFNTAAGDRAEVETIVPAGAPTINMIGYEEGKRTDWDAQPAIIVRSYLKNDRKSFLLINRNPLVEYPIMLKTGDADVSYRVTTLAGSRPEKGTLEGPGLLPGDPAERILSKVFEAVQPRTQDVKSAQTGVNVALPPASIVTVQPTAGLE